jgi:hypothetical protein
MYSGSGPLVAVLICVAEAAIGAEFWHAARSVAPATQQMHTKRIPRVNPILRCPIKVPSIPFACLEMQRRQHDKTRAQLRRCHFGGKMQ